MVLRSMAEIDRFSVAGPGGAAALEAAQAVSLRRFAQLARIGEDAKYKQRQRRVMLQQASGPCALPSFENFFTTFDVKKKEMACGEGEGIVGNKQGLKTT